MRCDTVKKNTPSKQFGTPGKILRPKTPATMTAKRVPVVSKPSVTATSTGSNVKWADVLTPSKAVQDPLKRALFSEEPLTPDTIKEEPKTSNQSTPNTSQGAVSPRLSLSDADLKKFQEIEEREKKLLEEIQSMSRQSKAKGQMEKLSESPEQVAARENIDLCAASFQKAADNYALYHRTKSQEESVCSGSEFSLGPSPDRDSLGDLKKGAHQLGHSPLSDADSAVDMGSMHNCTIDELNQSLSVSQTHFERLQSEFRTLQSGHGNGGDIMTKLQQIEKQQRLVLRQQQDLRKQLAEQQKQLVEQQKLMSEKTHQVSPPSSGAQNEAQTPCSVVSGASRRFSTSENSPFAMFNRCQSMHKDSRGEREIHVPTSVRLSPAVILSENTDIPIRTPLAMVENTRRHVHKTPVKLFPSCTEEQATPLQSVQSAFKRTRLTNSETESSHDSFEIGPGLLNMTPYTAATTKVRTKLLAKTILCATSKKYHNALLDEEVGLYMACGRKEVEERFDACCRLMNPVAKTLLEGDEMHFIPIQEELTRQGYTPAGSAFSTFIR